ncbi:hypothetical protein AB5I41_12745 [Sphingomonas sp. MMS24-JH45]
MAQAVAWRQLNRLNTQRAKAELAQGNSSSIMSLGKLAMSRILHEVARVRSALLGPESLLEGPEHPRAEDANFLALNAYFTSIGAAPIRSSATSSANGCWGCRRSRKSTGPSPSAR